MKITEYNNSTNFKIGLDIKLKHGLLLQWMSANNLNQSEVARRLNITPNAFGRIINMQWIPDESLQIKIAEITGMEIEDLFPIAYQREIRAEKRIRAIRVRLVKEVNREELNGVLQRLSGGDENRYLKPPDEILQEKQEVEMLKSAMDKHLTAREEEILRLRFGVDKEKSYQLDEVAKCFSLSKERIRQIEKHALEKLETALEPLKYG